MKFKIGPNDIIPEGEYELTDENKLANARGNIPSSSNQQILIEYDRIAGRVLRNGQVLPPQSLWKLQEKKAYPRGYSNEQLELLVDRYGDLNVDKFNIGPSYFTKAALGLTELQRRESSQMGWWSFRVSILALIFSIVAIWFAYQALHEDQKWKSEEVNLLTQIVESLKQGASQ